MIADVDEITAQEQQLEVELMEVGLLLEAVHRRYGLDFREYAPASLRRRLWRRARAEGADTLSGLQALILRDAACMERLLLDLSVTTTGLFRDPAFWLAFRRQVVPKLRTHPFLRIWSAGCSTGQEAYSLAILLHEEGLLDRTRIYATDSSAAALATGREGVYGLASVHGAQAEYAAAGGTGALSDYYTAAYESARLRRTLAGSITWGQHNLAGDGSFNEFHVVLCRNVLIYFAKPLQDRVHALLHDSLAPFGVLGLGARESLRFTARESGYATVSEEHRLYRRQP